MGRTDRGLQDKIRYSKKDIIKAPRMRGSEIRITVKLSAFQTFQSIPVLFEAIR